MRIAVHAVGRMKAGPERDLADRYFDRLAKAGPSVGLDWAGITEIPESRAQSADLRKQEEADRLGSLMDGDTALLVLDERGKNLASEAFADWLAARRDEGRRKLLIALGGPDGHTESSRRDAALVLSFGAMTWPHQVARVMLAEQLYRAATILAGHPYHRA